MIFDEAPLSCTMCDKVWFVWILGFNSSTLVDEAKGFDVTLQAFTMDPRVNFRYFPYIMYICPKASPEPLGSTMSIKFLLRFAFFVLRHFQPDLMTAVTFNLDSCNYKVANTKQPWHHFHWKSESHTWLYHWIQYCCSSKSDLLSINFCLYLH